MKSRELKFKKENGVVDVIALQEWFHQQLCTLSNGDWTVAITKKREGRTNAQNALMWVWFNIIAQAWSEASGRVFTPENVHNAYCQLFLPVTTPKGVNLAGETKNLSKDEMTEFLNRVQADAQMEYGISLPSGEDLYLEQWADSYGIKLKTSRI